MPSATRRRWRRHRPGVGAPCLPRSCLADRVRHRPQQRPAAHAQTRRASVRSQPGSLAVCLVRSNRLAYSQYTLSPIMSNDFDETLPGPFEWDVKRLVTSCVLAARWLGLDADDARRSAVTAVASYRTAMARFAAMSVLDIWYAKVTMDAVFKEYADDPKVVKLLKRSVDKALHSTTEHVFHSIAKVENGKTRINDHPPLLFHPDATELDMEREVRPFFANYRASLPRDRRALFDRFEVIDVVHKVVGVGSVGTRCFIALFSGDQGDHLFFQVKEAPPSVLGGVPGAPAA